MKSKRPNRETLLALFTDEPWALPMTTLSLIVEGYDESGFPRTRVPIDGEPDAVVQRVLAAPAVTYAHLRNAEAGCFIARIERG